MLSCEGIVRGEKLWHDQDSNPGPFADHVNTLPLSYRAAPSSHLQLFTLNPGYIRNMYLLVISWFCETLTQTTLTVTLYSFIFLLKSSATCTKSILKWAGVHFTFLDGIFSGEGGNVASVIGDCWLSNMTLDVEFTISIQSSNASINMSQVGLMRDVTLSNFCKTKWHCEYKTIWKYKMLWIWTADYNKFTNLRNKHIQWAYFKLQLWYQETPNQHK